MSMTDERPIKVGTLIELLKQYPDDCELMFSGGLDFYRLKLRDTKLLQVEFDQNVWKNSKGEWRVDD